MSPLLPPQLLPFAGLLALVVLWPRLRAPRSSVQTVLEAVGTTLLMIAVVWLAWVALWCVEQRW